MNRRKFLGATAAALASSSLSPSASAYSPRPGDDQAPVQQRKKLPIGVFNPPFHNLSLDQMLEKFSSLGIEAVEIGAGGYSGTPQCPLAELLASPAKAREWKQKFVDRNIPVMALSCHANPLHPDAAKAGAFAQQFRQTIQLAGLLEIPTVIGFSGCPGASPADTVPNWIIYGWPDVAGPLEWQWNERVIPYWTETAKFARDHGVNRIALEMHPNFVVYNPRTLMRLRAAVGPVIGANCDLSHLFWQGCDAIEVIRFLGKEKALYHAHMKDTAFFPENVARYGVLNFARSKDDRDGSEFFRAVGYGHGASFWKDVIATYMEVGYDGMLSIENEDPILSSEVGVERALSTLKNVRAELMAG